MSAMLKLYRVALRFLPPDFQQTYGSGMLETFAEKLKASRAHGRTGRTLFFLGREIIGVLTLAARERSKVRKRRNRAEARLTGNALRDLRYAARGLRRTPGFTIPSLLTLALGVGATVTIFSVVRGVVLKPLPYPDSDQIVVLDHAAPGIDLERDLGLTRGMYAAYAERTDLFDGTAMYDVGQLTLSAQDVSEQVSIARITPSAANVFRTSPASGRWFAQDEGAPGSSPVALISHDLWTEHFGSAASMVGQAVRLQGVSTTIIGVMPPGFDFPDRDTQVWMPLQVAAGFGGFNFRAVARLRTEIGASQVQRQLNDVIAQLPDRFPGTFASNAVEDARIAALVPTLQDEIVGHVSVTLWVLLGSVGFIWLMACANVANLLLVRSERRRHESAIRAALGANRSQLITATIAEIGLLGFAGVACGIVIAWAGVMTLIGLGPENIPRLEHVRIDSGVLGFSLLLAVASTLLLSVVSLSSLTHRVAGTLRAGGRRTSASESTSRFRRIIGVVQIAVAVVLLVGSGLMLRTFRELQRVDIGFSPTNALTFEIGLTTVDYPARADAAAFQQALTARLSGLPGVAAVGAVSRCLPFEGWCGGDPLAVQGRPAPEGEIPQIVALRSADVGYLNAMNIPLLAGRWLERFDENRQTNSVVVSAALAESYWPNEDPVGQRVSDQGTSTADSAWYTVVGVVGNVPARRITETETPIIYFPIESRSGRGPSPHTMRIALKTTVAPVSLVPSVRGVVAALDGNVPLANVQTLANIVSEATATTTFVTLLLGTAAAMALFLGTVGVYAVISYSVAQRQNELGIRIALGASKGIVNRLILTQGFSLTGLGIAVGLAGAFGLSRYMESLLYQVGPNDAMTYGAVVIVLGLAALTASYLPARRAAKVDPVIALRDT